jgi:UDP-N-acetylmuramoyl-L-alanyl-D-glutamate--2,6-diaminopimelate ligase
MQAGVSITQRRKVQQIEDRRAAIIKACEIANPEDIILIAGKGHETYQDIKGVKSHFDDREELLKAFLA